MTSTADLPTVISSIEQMQRFNEAWIAADRPSPDFDEGWRRVADLYGCSDNDLRIIRKKLSDQPPETPPFSADEIADLKARATQLASVPKAPLTTALRDGTVVLAKLYHGNPSALTYANRTQANKAAARVQGEVIGSRPFYVRMKATTN